jgi:phosphate transport system substrate-binding protein
LEGARDPSAHPGGARLRHCDPNRQSDHGIRQPRRFEGPLPGRLTAGGRALYRRHRAGDVGHPLIADIFLGKIKSWSDPAIKALNPELQFPDAGIVVVHRSDGSGTTFSFTNYLAKVSPEWREKVGSDLIVPWPLGEGAKGNKGVAEKVAATKNAIGYVEYAQALQSKLSFAAIQNRNGTFMKPDAASFQAAAADAAWDQGSDFNLLLTDASGKDAYPIVAPVFVLMRDQAAPIRTRAALNLFEWAFDRGAGEASTLGYVPLPKPLVAQIKDYWAKNLLPDS